MSLPAKSSRRVVISIFIIQKTAEEIVQRCDYGNILGDNNDNNNNNKRTDFERVHFLDEKQERNEDKIDQGREINS